VKRVFGILVVLDATEDVRDPARHPWTDQYIPDSQHHFDKIPGLWHQFFVREVRERSENQKLCFASEPPRPPPPGYVMMLVGRPAPPTPGRWSVGRSSAAPPRSPSDAFGSCLFVCLLVFCFNLVWFACFLYDWLFYLFICLLVAFLLLFVLFALFVCAFASCLICFIFIVCLFVFLLVCAGRPFRGPLPHDRWSAVPRCAVEWPLGPDRIVTSPPPHPPGYDPNRNPEFLDELFDMNFMLILYGFVCGFDEALIRIWQDLIRIRWRFDMNLIGFDMDVMGILCGFVMGLIRFWKRIL